MRALFFAFVILVTAAEPAKAERTVRLEWDADSDALTYQIEIGRRGQTQPLQSFSDLAEPRWVGILPPGPYWMRIRGKDDRGVAGEWGDRTEFRVKPGLAQVISPQPFAALQSATEDLDVTFEWRPLTHSLGYAFTLLDENDQPVRSERLQEARHQLKLEAGRKYRWFVQGVDEDGSVGDRPSEITEFTLVGPAVPEVALIPPETAFVRRLEWKAPVRAQGAKISLQHFDKQKQSWVPVHEEEVKGKNHLTFNRRWSGGSYQLVAQPLAPYRLPTAPTQISFEVASGSRSVATEQQALIRESIDRVQSLFGAVSYFMSQINYEARLFNQNRTAAFEGLTGSLSALLGYNFEEWPAGWLTGLELSSLTMNGRQHLFGGLESMGIYRWSPTRRGDLRAKAGAFLQLVPEITDSATEIRLGNSQALGLGGEIEYWHALTNKWALQSSISLKQGLSGRSAGGKSLSQAQFINFGFQGAYRWHSDLSLLGGYAYRLDQVRFEDENQSFGATGETDLKMTGHYLKLSLELNF